MKTLRLESFATANAVIASEDILAPDTEARLATYEEGYAAGWEDAAAARREEDALTEQEIARTLATMGFTLQEARQQVILSLRPLIEAVVTQILPVAARESLPHLVLDALIPLAEERASIPLQLRLNPASRGVIEKHLLRAAAPDFTIAEDASLSPGQVVVTAGDAGARIDLDAVARDIETALRDFHEILSTERSHG